MSLYWHTNSTGELLAEMWLYHLTVERLLPAEEARFTVWVGDDTRVVRAAGIAPTTRAAMDAAEAAASRLCMAAAHRQDGLEDMAN